jgi:hypothetical protein
MCNPQRRFLNLNDQRCCHDESLEIVCALTLSLRPTERGV